MEDREINWETVRQRIRVIITHNFQHPPLLIRIADDCAVKS